MMQTSAPSMSQPLGPSAPVSNVCSSLDPNAPVFHPGCRNLWDYSDFINDLHAIWRRHAWRTDGEDLVLSIATWYLAPGRELHRCLLSRPAQLAEDFTLWESALRAVWSDIDFDHLPVDFALVFPEPPFLEPGIAAHVILVQQPVESTIGCLVTVFDDPTYMSHQRQAVILNEAIRFDNVLTMTGYHLVHADFAIWHALQRIQPGTQVMGCDGAAISLQVHRNFVHVQPSTSDQVYFLQLSAHLSSRPAERKTLELPLHDVIQAFERFDAHFFLPAFDLECIGESHPAFSWLHCWWDGLTPASCIRIYFDGSSMSHCDNAVASAAVAAFVQIEGTWYFAGAWSTTLLHAHDSYHAELGGAFLSSKFAYDLLKIHEALGSVMPEVVFIFDSVTVGKQASGEWHCFADETSGACIRNCQRLVESRFGIQPQFLHTKSHQGEPGNWLVDTLAQFAITHSALTPCEDWLAFHMSRKFCNDAAWFWILFDKDFQLPWHEQRMLFPLPDSQPDLATFAGLPQLHSDTPVQRDWFDLHLRLATCNVLSLCGTRSEDVGELVGPARLAIILRQMSEERITCFALQETRLRKLHHKHSDDYFLFRSAATQQGHFGIMVGFARRLAFASSASSQHEVFFQDSHFAIIHADPRALLIRVANPCLRTIIIAAHAPHSGNSQEALEAWWSDLSHLIPDKYRAWSLVLMVDANANVGSDVSEQIGGHQAGRADAKSEPFVEFIHRHGLWLPATFETCHVGDGATWYHPNGSGKRIDFIGLPSAWVLTSCNAWTSQVIDPSLAKTDHLAACVDLRFRSPSHRPFQRHSHMLKLPFHSSMLEVLSSFSLSPVDFHVDVHTHADRIQEALHSALVPCRCPRYRRALKSSLSESTWALVCHERDCRQHLAELNQLQKQHVLRGFFHCWRGKADQHDRSQFDALVIDLDSLIAKALFEFRHLGRLSAVAVRKDDATFYQNLLRDGAEFLSPADTKKFWQVIRRSMPKFKQRNLHIAPSKMVTLEAQMIPHLCSLELGECMQPEILLADCHARQLNALASLPPCEPSVSVLPTLTDLEASLRKSQPERSTGLDPFPSGLYHACAPRLAKVYCALLLKMHLWATEPLQFKGGVMCLIPKKGDLNLAHNDRGILLLASIAKRIHGLLRHQLMTKLQPRRLSGQFGGFPGQMVQFGITFLVDCAPSF